MPTIQEKTRKRVVVPATSEAGAGSRVPRLVAWQGYSLNVPDDWDLTGFSGNDEAGYLRADDSADLGLELKWATEGKRSKPPKISERLETYFRALKDTARKKRLTVDTKVTDAPRGVERPERTVLGFRWFGDKQATGAIWYCSVCRRVSIVQVLGPGSGGIGKLSEAILSRITCHDENPDWRVWSLYDLRIEIPKKYTLAEQQLMNVYLRLSFADSTARLCVEQWSLANVARQGNYLDEWLKYNARGPLMHARYDADEGEANGHPALMLKGGLAFGQPWAQAIREAASLHYPATKFSAVAWECEASNKMYAVESLRPGRAKDVLAEVVARTRCHGGGSSEAGGA